ncbi:sigma-54-dependent Fis family transcriptional regulator [Candidatus Sumerlaeota bacterium]|nr:sigma-54-dependent Fis family transcriptional regulator [Candidatus Sumerlaeota bacterium]
MKRKILIVDDEQNTREGMKWALEGSEKKYEVYTCADAESGLAVALEKQVELIITDLKMPGMDGMELLRRVKEKMPEVQVIVPTGYGTIESAVEAMKLGAFDYVLKPINIDELNLIVERALQHKRMKEENIALRQVIDKKFGFENILGNSPAMENIFRQIRMVAPTKSTVLIQGESGTGKELIASAIHYNSPRKNKPFIIVNCGALTPTLLESELFGHEKGAFTDAYREKPGRFELADGGTLFLDEISETTSEFQVKLLRVIETQTFERVGGTESITVDVRIITATNKNLKELVQQGKFRQDLYYRLNVIQIYVPPLRERREDIPLLVNAFVKELCEKNKKPLMSVSPKTMALLQNYDWPGNVRQLKNVIEAAVIMCNTQEIQPRHLPEEIREAEQSNADEETVCLKIGSSLRDAEIALIRATLKRVNDNKTKAAKILGIGRKTLYRKLEEYGISG